jgi:hypothetical protein
MMLKHACIIGAALMFSGCAATIPKGALEMSQQTLEWRKLQGRSFDTSDEKKILSASAALLQDLGFTLSESETGLGVISATKDRSARDGGQMALAFIASAIGGGPAIYDESQKFIASVVTRPYGEGNEKILVRVTFQRRVWSSQGQISKLERITDPEMYTEFFQKLEKSIFLNANNI